jgi:protoporphyrinogen oxidase
MAIGEPDYYQLYNSNYPSMTTKKHEVVIIGAGITSLAAATVLKDDAIIFERHDRAGGLVRSHCFDGGYWFDHVLHVFHCNNRDVLNRVQTMLGPALKKCTPVAWIETSEGVVRYPFQLNIGSLPTAAKIKCISDFSKAYFSKPTAYSSSSYKEFLTNAFGKSMCELFYYPYNEKLWKYPLEEISAGGQLWNLHQPSFEAFLQGAFEPNKFRETYNTNAFYPQPPKNSKLRGMEILANGLTKHVNNLHLNIEVIQIDPLNKLVLTRTAGLISEFGFNECCFSTIPMPALIKICKKVLSIGLSINGERPVNPGHWRYYTSPDVPFSRLIFMTEFDKHNAPENGWSLLVEITLPSGYQQPGMEKIKTDVVNCLKNIGVINAAHRVIGMHSWIADPAYVIFTPETQTITGYCLEYLEKNKIMSSGRYGKWEYSSMSRNIEDGFNFAELIKKQ